MVDHQSFQPHRHYRISKVIFLCRFCERLLIAIVILNLSTSTERPEIELGRSSLPSGYLSGINGAIIHPPSDPVKRPKMGMGLHLFNAAALLAGVGFGSDIRLISATQPMQFRRYYYNVFLSL